MNSMQSTAGSATALHAPAHRLLACPGSTHHFLSGQAFSFLKISHQCPGISVAQAAGLCNVLGPLGVKSQWATAYHNAACCRFFIFIWLFKVFHNHNDIISWGGTNKSVIHT